MNIKLRILAIEYSKSGGVGKEQELLKRDLIDKIKERHLIRYYTEKRC